MKKGTFPILLIILIHMSSFTPPNQDSIMVFEFNSQSNISSWRVVNDDVMGGVSSSSFTLSKEYKGLFTGHVSTDNYGGFASVRYSMPTIRIGKMNALKIRIKGDGKDYQFRLKHKSTDYYSYVTTFPTSGNWQTLELNLSEFYPSFRGRKLDIPNFDKKSISQISILIANKKNEAFELEIDRIELISE